MMPKKKKKRKYSWIEQRLISFGVDPPKKGERYYERGKGTRTREQRFFDKVWKESGGND